MALLIASSVMRFLPARHTISPCTGLVTNNIFIQCHKMATWWGELLELRVFCTPPQMRGNFNCLAEINILNTKILQTLEKCIMEWQNLSVHRPNKYCFPLKFARHPTKGLHLVATRDIKPLEIIIDQYPTVGGPYARPPNPQCLEVSAT